MKWNKLLCEKRYITYSRAKRTDDLRNEFQKDYHRIICSASFRRLQDKTQVFPLDKSDFIRTRLTHSLEVSSFAKSLGQMVFQYIIDNDMDHEVDVDVKEKVCSILECAGLLHDIGNPPFGHFGEASIRNWFADKLPKLCVDGACISDILTDQMKADLCHFEGNAQAIRLLSKLHYLIDENGMHLTYALLNTLIKYPVSSLETNKNDENIMYHKIGYYYAEKELFDDIVSNTGTVGCRYPLTFLLEAADDIAYITADLEDAVKKGLITFDKLLYELSNSEYRHDCTDEKQVSCYDNVVSILLDKKKSADKKGINDPEMNAVQNWVIYIQGTMLRSAAKVFTNNYKEIMKGSFLTDLISASSVRCIAETLSQIEASYVFNSKQIIISEVAAGSVINFLLDNFIPAAIKYDSNIELAPREKRLMSIVSDNYRQIYHFYSRDRDDSFKLYLRLLLITDYISGMTDSYAKNLYQQLNGIE